MKSYCFQVKKVNFFKINYFKNKQIRQNSEKPIHVMSVRRVQCNQIKLFKNEFVSFFQNSQLFNNCEITKFTFDQKQRHKNTNDLTCISVYGNLILIYNTFPKNIFSDLCFLFALSFACLKWLNEFYLEKRVIR